MFNFHFKRVNHAYSSCLGVTPEEKGVAHESRLINKRVELRQRIAMCSPDTASIIVIIVMAVSGCCGVFVWISLFLGFAYLFCKYCKSRKYKRPRQRIPIRAHDNDDGGGHNTHWNVPQGPAAPMAILQPMTVFMPVYNQGTHQFPPAAGGNWIPSVDETNSTLYRSNRTMQHTSSANLQQSNPVYHDDGKSCSHSATNYAYTSGTHIHHHDSMCSGCHVISNHEELTGINESDDMDSPPPDYNSL